MKWNKINLKKKKIWEIQWGGSLKPFPNVQMEGRQVQKDNMGQQVRLRGKKHWRERVSYIIMMMMVSRIIARPSVTKDMAAEKWGRGRGFRKGKVIKSSGSWIMWEWEKWWGDHQKSLVFRVNRLAFLCSQSCQEAWRRHKNRSCPCFTPIQQILRAPFLGQINTLAYNSYTDRSTRTSLRKWKWTCGLAGLFPNRNWIRSRRRKLIGEGTMRWNGNRREWIGPIELDILCGGTTYTGRISVYVPVPVSRKKTEEVQKVHVKNWTYHPVHYILVQN